MYFFIIFNSGDPGSALQYIADFIYNMPVPGLRTSLSTLVLNSAQMHHKKTQLTDKRIGVKLP